MIIPIPAAATVTMDANVEHRTEGLPIFTLTPTANTTINAITDGLPDQMYILKITTSGTTSYTVTFGTNFLKTGTLATGTTSGVVFSILFYSDGQNLVELSRTAAAS